MSTQKTASDHRLVLVSKQCSGRCCGREGAFATTPAAATNLRARRLLSPPRGLVWRQERVWLLLLYFFHSTTHAKVPFGEWPSIDIRPNAGLGLSTTSILSSGDSFNHAEEEARPLTSTGRARVVVDEIESDFLLDILLNGKKFGRKDNLSSHITSAPRVVLNLQSPPSIDSDLELAWSEPVSSSGEARKEDDSFAKFASRDQNPASTKSRFTSTGTTIVGLAGPDWCVLAADSRATSGTMVADKRCFKLHPLASNCAAAGAGTSADLDHLTRECSFAARLMQQSVEHGNQPADMTMTTTTTASNESTSWSPIITRSPISVLYLCQYMLDRLYRQGGSCQANLIVGGVYQGRSVLRAIHPHGSMDVVSYTALGSGGLPAMGVLESQCHGGGGTVDLSSMTMDEATVLAVEAVKAGINHDMGSGSQVDVCIIGPDGLAKYKRCILAEDSLNSLPEVEKADRSVNLAEAGVVVDAHGVNGFGNLPYIIRSRRIIQNSRENQERLHEMRWDSILGS